MSLKNQIGGIIDRIRLPAGDPATREFHSHAYLRYNARRLEHLASLRIPVEGLSVLEVGAGIGDLSSYYLDRECCMTITEARPANLAHLQKRYPQADIQHLDLDAPELPGDVQYNVVHCYGVLYHLREPVRAIEFLASRCRQYMFLESCVSFGDDEAVHPIAETQRHPSQAVSGVGCRPTRPWLFHQLKKHFEFVYIPRTQPNHDEFPIDWTAAPPSSGYVRSVFIASRERIRNDQLTDELLLRQTRHP